MSAAGWVLLLVGLLLASAMFGWVAFVSIVLVSVGAFLIGAA